MTYIRRIAVVCAAALALIAVLGGQAPAATVTLNPVADAYIRQFDPDRTLGIDYGSEPSMVAGALGSRAQFEVRRALLRFDLSQIPAGAVVNSATLQLTVVMVPMTPVNSTFDIRRVLQSWSEGAASWNSRLGAGTPWQVPGATGSADSISTPSSFVAVGSANFTTYTFPSMAGLAADVQGWINNPSSNFGWLLISENEVSPETARRFGTREDPTHAAVLTINYSLPSLGVTIQPSSQTVPAGGTATFTANATGTPPFSYQWSFSGNPITGATSGSLVLTNVQTSQSGSYTVTVSDQTGTVASAPATLTVTGAQGPSVTITSPANNAVFPAQSDVLVAAEATESNGTINFVEFLLGTNVVGVVSNSPYSLIMSNLSTGVYVLTASATDTQGNVGISAPVNFSIGLPTVTIASPTNGAQFPDHADVVLAASASEPGAVITNIAFFLNTTNLVGQAASDSLSIIASDLLAGNYVFTAQATDNQSNVISSTVNFFVVPPPDVALTAPGSNSSFALGSNIVITAFVTSKGANISRVDFLASRTLRDGNLEVIDIGGSSTNLTAPQTIIWLPTEPGDYILFARALDELGQTGESAGVPIRVFIPELILPTITVTSAPPNFSRQTESPITIQGTASDNIGVDQIKFQVLSGRFLQNSSAPQTADGTTNWSASVPLVPGKNAIRFWSQDLATNKSAVVTLFYTYFTQASLTVIKNGEGTITPNLDGRLLELGKLFTMTARPASGQVFWRWEMRTNEDLTLTNGVTFITNNVLSFEMKSNLVLVANFVENPFPGVAAYGGLFFEAGTNFFRPENAGLFMLRLAKNGGFSGRIVLEGAAYPFTGQFDLSGTSRVAVVRRALPPVAIGLQLDMLGGGTNVTGTVRTASDANVLTSRLEANRVGDSGAFAGQRSFALLDEAGDNIASAIASVNSAGNVIIHGILQPFRTFTVTTSISSDGSVPFYVSFNQGSEVITGWLQFGDDGSTVTGQLFWVSPSFEGVSLLNAVGQ